MTARVLVVTSTGAPAGAVTPVLAALEASDLEVRAIDVGRAGARYTDGVIDSVVRTVAGELAERRLMREIERNPPDVAITFDPATTAALSVVRDDSVRPAPVIAVVADLDPDSTWAATDADRYLTVDDEAAVDLADHGVEAERILVVGPFGERAFVDAAAVDRATLRTRFKLDAGSPIVVFEVAGLGYDMTSQIVLQLSLLSARAMFLFDAGADSEATTALRRQVPTLDLRAKLFGRTDDAPLFWRAADLVVARPSDRSVTRAMQLGAHMVAFMPVDKNGEDLARAVETRRLGGSATSPLLLSSAIEPFLARKAREPGKDARIGADGAGTVADVAWIVASERRDVLDERRQAARASTRARIEAAAEAAEAAAHVSSPAGGLEDLSGGSGSAAEEAAPSADEIAALRAEAAQRLEQAGRTVAESREAAERQDRRAQAARASGDESAASAAESAAEAERARMHAALSEMATLQGEVDRLKAAAGRIPASRGRAARPAGGGTSRAAPGTSRPGAGRPGGAEAASPGRGSLDDMIDGMRKKSAQQKATIDDELDALKRKMRSQKKP